MPRALYDEGIRRYGFHGLSYEYIAERLPEVAPEIAGGRVIVAHLGSGASMCAMAGGRSVESTMGFTALDGLPMGTRPGQLDPGVVLYLIEEKGHDRRRGHPAPLPRRRPQGPLRRLQRHARPARQRRPARRLRDRPLRLPLRACTPARSRPRSAASTPSSSPPASARTPPAIRARIAERLALARRRARPRRERSRRHPHLDARPAASPSSSSRPTRS